MAAIRPFRALRYHWDAVKDLSRVIAPPYDVISAEEQERLYQASPYNIVRLILGRESPIDTGGDNRYTRARRDFTAWREQGVLRADPVPALYLVAQTFQDTVRSRCRLGFIALLELSEAVPRAVYRHEATLEAPKADRAKLLEAVPANLSPIFCVYPDPDAAVQARLQAVSERATPAAAASMHGEEIRLWVVTDHDLIREVARRLAAVDVLIADGHHRFEVAYAHRMRYGALMSYFVSMEDPALVVRPIHRVAHGPEPLEAARLAGLCTVEPAPNLASLLQWLDGAGTEGCFGYADGRRLSRLRVRPEVLARWLMAPPVPQPLAALDVSLLHGLVFPSLGLSGAMVSYTPEASRALQMAQGPPQRSAWFLRGIPLSQVYAVAAQGLTLPPKSTYFYPKVPSGLTMNVFEG